MLQKALFVPNSSKLSILTRMSSGNIFWQKKQLMLAPKVELKSLSRDLTIRNGYKSSFHYLGLLSDDGLSRFRLHRLQLLILVLLLGELSGLLLRSGSGTFSGFLSGIFLLLLSGTLPLLLLVPGGQEPVLEPLLGGSVDRDEVDADDGEDEEQEEDSRGDQIHVGRDRKVFEKSSSKQQKRQKVYIKEAILVKKYL